MEIDVDKNSGKLLAILNTMQMQWCNAGKFYPMDHILGFTQSHWMPPLDECLGRIGPVTTMVDDFGGKHKTL